MNPKAALISEIAYLTTDRLFLVYDYAKATKRYSMSWRTESFIKSLSKAKEQKPRIDAFSGTLKGLFLDFDNLDLLKSVIPASFSDSWDNVARWIELRFSTEGCMFRSASGKVKVFIPIQTDRMTQQQAKAYALKAFPSYFNAIDHKSGLRYSFVDTVSDKIISKYLKSNEYELAVKNNTESFNQGKKIEKSKDILDTSSPSEYVWRSYTGSIPSNMLESLKTKNTNIEGVIRFALGTNTCISTGVAIPQVLLGQTLGIPQRTAGRAIRVLIDLGVLKVTNTAKLGYRAAKYQFCGLWLRWAMGVLKTSSEAVSGSRNAIVETINDGNWNEPLFTLTNYFQSESEYLGFVEAIPGFRDKPERERQAYNAWKCHTNIDTNKLKKEVRKYA